MKRVICFTAVLFLVSCKTTSYFIVRHAEKETANTMVSDVPLSAKGQERAIALKEKLSTENIRHIYSTNYTRTKSTAAPLSEATGIAIETYNPADTGFVYRLKLIHDGNVLVVGHSNTVDDIVNKLVGKTVIETDLADTRYGDLFIVRKKGNKYFFQKEHFGN